MTFPVRLAPALFWSLCLTLTLAGQGVGADPDIPELVVTKDTKLDPAKTYGRIVIDASNIKLDGAGVTLVGPKPDKPNKRTGVAISGKGVSNVRITNLNARGWETGLKAEGGEAWHIEKCDFSDNFHDPEFGWGENGHRGGIVFFQMKKCTIQKCKANRVWDACVLVNSDGNRISENDFSHTSNTCLKMWTACSNVIERNKLDYGIRIQKDEVHARDSTCVLLESGSDHNVFEKNSITHGGDGVFIRSLNNWVSTGNVFRENDCSHANNNAVECWSPGNIFIRNKANDSSYGFWMGGSDDTVLQNNEASRNGNPKGNHNSPHLPEKGHAGIVFLYGTGSHLVIRDNKCRDNNGAGIALIGDQSPAKKWKAFHAIVEGNELDSNRWGIYLQNADWITLAENKFQNNKDEVNDAGNVTRLTQKQSGLPKISQPFAKIRAPKVVKVGDKITLDSVGSEDLADLKLTREWMVENGPISDKETVELKAETPGTIRVALNVSNGRLSNLAWADITVIDPTEEKATEKAAGQWSWTDRDSKVSFADDKEIKLVGDASLRADVSPYGGGRCTLDFKATEGGAISLEGKKQLTFWIRARNENIPAWQGENPIITLRDGSETLTLTPLFDPLNNPAPEARLGWTRMVVPLDGSKQWKLAGKRPAGVKSLSLGFDSWGGAPLHIWIDGLRFE